MPTITRLIAALISIAITAATPAQSANPSSIPSSEAVHALLAERMAHNGVGIVVGIIEPAGRRVISYGKLSTKDRRVPDGDTIYQIGSVTKVFTGLLLADAVQRGEVGLEDPAARYLPTGATLPEKGRAITLLDLIAHRSALPSMPTNFSLQGKPDPYASYSVDELHRFLSTYELSREPGARGVYSNLGVSLLGRLLAYRAGTEYEALLQSRVLQPLGMTSTAVVLSSEQRKRLAPGHDRYLDPVDSWNLTQLPGSGGLRSSANDMLIFMAANLGYTDTPLKHAMAFQRDTRYPGNPSRALAWSVGKNGTSEIFGHDGGKEGYRSALVLDPAARTGVVVLTNSRSDDRPFDLAVHLLTGRTLKPAPPAPAKPKLVKLTVRELDAIAGRYRRAPDSDIVVARHDRRLYVDFIGDGIVTLDPTSPRDFVSNVEDLQLTFEPGGMVIREAGKESHATRIN